LNQWISEIRETWKVAAICRHFEVLKQRRIRVLPSLISPARNIFGTNIFETAVNMDFKLFYISLQNSGHIKESSRSPHWIRDKPFSFSYPPRFARLGYENSKGLSRMQFGARELSNKIVSCYIFHQVFKIYFLFAAFRLKVVNDIKITLWSLNYHN
jgi:hypothetical protein